MSKIGTVNKTNKTIKKHDFYVKKKFGQNFLTDQNILRKITDVADINEETLVVEIGPGLGSMTELLLQKSKNVLAYEIDKDLIPILKENLDNDKLYYVQISPIVGNVERLPSRTLGFMPFNYSTTLPSIKYGEGKFLGGSYD